MSWARYRREFKRAEREAVRREKVLAKQRALHAKLTEQENARLEVEEYENHIEVLLSVHKEQPGNWDWHMIASQLPPPPPVRLTQHELITKQNIAVLPPHKREGAEEAIEVARLRDEQIFQAALASYAELKREWETMNLLATDILQGKEQAYRQAIIKLSPLSEIEHFGSTIECKIHSPSLLECEITLGSSDVIPAETKSLTSTGKLSTKATPRARLQELYQDYICSCMLRVAREMFAVLPIQTLLLTAIAPVFDSASGQTSERPVLSVAIERSRPQHLNFDLLDPSDAIESFTHRGDFKASRKSGAFQEIVPLTPTDVGQSASHELKLDSLLSEAEKLRAEVLVIAKTLSRSTTPASNEQ